MQCNIQLGQSELGEGKPACMYWRSVPISDNAVMRLQPALPPFDPGSGPQFPTWTSEHAAPSVWAMEGYFMVCILTLVPALSLHTLPVYFTYEGDVGMLCSCALPCTCSCALPCTWALQTSLTNINVLKLWQHFLLLAMQLSSPIC